jgi:hypothetical protein
MRNINTYYEIYEWDLLLPPGVSARRRGLGPLTYKLPHINFKKAANEGLYNFEA